MKNYIKSIILLLALLATGTPALADTFLVDGIYYNIEGSNATVTHSPIPFHSNFYTGDVTIPETVTHNGTTYPVTKIGESAFAGCTGVTSVSIPNSVTYIDDEAFDGCSGLTNMTIPASVNHIGSAVFMYCTGLSSIVVASGNARYDSRGNCNAIIETEYDFLVSGCKNTVIPNTVKTIGDRAFSGCSDLTSITIPDSVTDIGENAFGACTGLTTVTIPNSVTYIGYGAFEDCSGLTSVSIGNSVTYIGFTTFFGCIGLKSVTCLAVEPPTIYSDTFDSANYSNATLYVPDESMIAYITASYWKNFNNIRLISEQPGELPGDVDGDGNVGIGDVSALIDYLLSGDATGVNQAAADADGNGHVDIGDVSALIDYLLSGHW